MKESSTDEADIFEGLKWGNVLAMIAILRETTYTKREHIEKRYSERATRFGETLEFVECLRAIREAEGHLRVTDSLRAGNEPGARCWLVERLFQSPNRYRTQLFRYLRKFNIAYGEPRFRPSSGFRHRQSHVRNFLMELGVVKFDQAHDSYLIAADYLNLFIMAQDNRGKRSPAQVTYEQRARESLGLAAEEAIVYYERKRVGKTLSSRVEHVALKNAAAGYDVRSVTVERDGKVIPRYIEVKAVSGSSLQFYWTRNEVLTAKLLGLWYYLYLLPVKNDGSFDLDGLKVVANPHVAVLQSSDPWEVEPDVLRCCLGRNMINKSGVLNNEV